MNILIKNTKALLPDGTTPAMDIAIAENKILALGNIPEDFVADKTIDGKNTFTIPGLINSHTHVSMTLLRSYADDMQLMDWLENKIWPIEGKMVKEDIYWGAMLGIVEMLKTGTTTFADMYGDMDQVAQACLDTDIRAVLSRGIIGINPNGNDALEENKALYRDFNGANNGKISVMFGPHAPYTCPPDFLKKVVAAAEEYNAEIHIHLAETKFEVENCLKTYGKTPIALMEEAGVLQQGTLAAHCVHLTEEDMDLMKKYKVRVAHNPCSNLKLASGFAPVPALLNKGICVALGTDGASSNNNLDMLEEVNLAALIHKGYNYDPLVVPAHTAVDMATKQGAEALNLPELGSLVEGYKADLVMLDLNDPAWHPQHNLVSLLAYSGKGNMTKNVIIDGKLIMENKTLLNIDEEKVIYEADRCTKALLSR